MERGKVPLTGQNARRTVSGLSWMLTPAVASDTWRTPEDMRPLRRLARGARALVKPRVRTALVLVLVGVPVVGFLLVAPWIADALWFHEVGHTDVYVRMQSTKLVLGG